MKIFSDISAETNLKSELVFVTNENIYAHVRKNREKYDNFPCRNYHFPY